MFIRDQGRFLVPDARFDKRREMDLLEVLNSQDNAGKGVANGYQIERLSISTENGTITGRWEFKNDTSGNPIETLRWNANQVLQDKRIVKYDEHGNMTEEQLFYPEQEKAVLHCKYTYELDAKNNWIVMKEYRQNYGGELMELLVREIQYDEP